MGEAEAAVVAMRRAPSGSTWFSTLRWSRPARPLRFRSSNGACRETAAFARTCCRGVSANSIGRLPRTRIRCVSATPLQKSS